MSTTSERMLHARIRHGLNQTQMGAMIGVCSMKVSHIERGHGSLSPDASSRLALLEKAEPAESTAGMIAECGAVRAFVTLTAPLCVGSPL